MRHPTFLLSRDSLKLVQQCWIRLHTSSNIVEATCAPRWLSNSSLQSLKPRGKGRSNSQAQLRVVGQQCCVLFHGALWVVSFARCTAVSTLLGVVASVCTPLPTRTQQLTPNIVGPTMLGVVASVCTWLKVFYSSKLHKSDIFVTISTKKWEVLPLFFSRMTWRSCSSIELQRSMYMYFSVEMFLLKGQWWIQLLS